VAPVADAPLRVVADEAREAAESATHSSSLPATATPHEFPPLVWEAYGRVAPATDRCLRMSEDGSSVSLAVDRCQTPSVASLAIAVGAKTATSVW